MAKKISPLLPLADELLQQFGERLRLARLRRGLSAKQVCERAGMAPMTLRSLERGASGVTIGAYLAVMQVLGIEQDLKLLGQVDTMGRSLQDARLPAPRIAAGGKKPNEPRMTSPRYDAIAQPGARDNNADALRKVPTPEYAEMVRLAVKGDAADKVRKGLKPHSAGMGRLGVSGSAATKASKTQVGVVNRSPTDWENNEEFISSSELSNLLTPSKKDK
jgi:transcriptional regulator with XRE-family HTH domain